MRRAHMFLHASVVLLAACSGGAARTPTESTDSTLTAADLAGRWTLTQVCGGFAGQCLPTLPSAEAQRYTFHADGTVDALVGDQPVSGTFMLADAAGQGAPDHEIELRLAGLPTRLLRIALPADGALRLAEPYPDGYTFDYRRTP